jgi:hypothetical protein
MWNFATAFQKTFRANEGKISSFENQSRILLFRKITKWTTNLKILIFKFYVGSFTQ